MTVAPVQEATGLDDQPIVTPTTVVKRDGRVVPFEVERIESALARCFASFGRRPHTHVAELSQRVVNIVAAKSRGVAPTVEGIQDTVELVLQAAGEFEAAKRYILYRAEHAKERQERPVPAEVRTAFAESDQYFPTPLQRFQFFDKYSRFDYDLGRRETWVETIDRAWNFLRELSQERLDAPTYGRIREAMLAMQAMPSMRLLAMAGPAARRNHVAIYNCSYQVVDSIEAFVEALIISMSGCGVGYSVESQYVENLPRIRRQTGAAPNHMVVEDSAEGWADALRAGLQTWFDGGDIRFDLSQLRAAGAPLRIKGGRASGPEPLRAMLDFARSRILARQGSCLRPIDAHDIMCSVGNAAVSGGVRRTALISLFDYDDHEMRHAKDGDFDRENSQRWNANNSAVWPSHGLTQLEVAQQVLDMVASGRGEPGIFNRQSALDLRPSRRQAADFGTNPCVTGDTWVLTEQGPQQVINLLGRATSVIVDGKAHSTTAHGFWETGVKPVLKLTTAEGHTLRLTANHKVLAVPSTGRNIEKPEWVEAGELQPGDKIKLHNHRQVSWQGDGTFDQGWLLGSLIGDGTFNAKTAKLTFWGEHRSTMLQAAVERLGHAVQTRADLRGYDQAEHNRSIVTSTGLRDLAHDYGVYRNDKQITPFIEQASSDFYCGFLQGLFDADGTVIGTQAKGVSVRLAQSDAALLAGVQRMLGRLGVQAVVSAQPGADHELIIANDNLQVYAELIGFSEPDKQARLATRLADYQRAPNRERFVATVASIVADGVEMVYDCTVPGINAFDANGIYVHNCGEILCGRWSFVT